MRKLLYLTAFMLAAASMSGNFRALAITGEQNQSQPVTTITGTVLDENNEAIIGASVVQKGVRGNAVATDAFGHFKIRVEAGTTLEISYIGYKTVEMAAANDMTVYMQPTTEALNQLVVVGYGTQKKPTLPVLSQQSM